MAQVELTKEQLMLIKLGKAMFDFIVDYDLYDLFDKLDDIVKRIQNRDTDDHVEVESAYEDYTCQCPACRKWTKTRILPGLTEWVICDHCSKRIWPYWKLQIEKQEQVKEKRMNVLLFWIIWWTISALLFLGLMKFGIL